MKKFSVIIPTLYKPTYLMGSLKSLCQIDSVDEIIVIENENCPFEKFYHEKTIYVKVYKNIYCNPAWNMGARMAKNDYICLLSDDILFDFNLVFSMIKDTDIMDHIGILGLSANCYNDIPNNDKIQIVPSFTRGFGFGSCMFMKKSNYIHIPEDLKILWGDEWLYRRQKNKPNYEISNLSTNKAVSVSSGDPAFSKILQEDCHAYDTKYRS